MSDDRLRGLRRGWRASDSLVDEVAYLRGRVRAGQLSRERLELAAYCGHEAAGAICWDGCQPSRLSGLELHDWAWGLHRWGPTVEARAAACLAALGYAELRQRGWSDYLDRLGQAVESLTARDGRPELVRELLEEWREEHAVVARRSHGAPVESAPHDAFSLVYFALTLSSLREPPERTEPVNLGKLLRTATRVRGDAARALAEDLVAWALG